MAGPKTDGVYWFQEGFGFTTSTAYVKTLPAWLTYPGRSGDILFAFNPLVELGGPPKYDPAQHGTPHDYDRRVPIIFWGPWKAEHRITPASEFNIRPEEKLDGVPLNLTAPQPNADRSPAAH